jgi:hypothetical protein
MERATAARPTRRWGGPVAGLLLVAAVVGRVGTFDDAVAQSSSATAASPADPAAPALASGEVLDRSNWEKAKGLLPPEILRHYQQGEYANRVATWDGPMEWEPRWHEATRWNREHLTIDEKGTIIDRSTGKQPPYIMGYPFPDIDPRDPQAGVKVLWNYFYRFYHNGNRRNQVELTWLSPDGAARKAGQDVYFLYYDGQPRERAPRENPNNLLFQFVAATLNPADLQGTTALAWRYRDAEKRDAVWSYVPALRRVRPISPTNRSDGFLGSDMSQDDGAFFDGKPEDFVWKLVGEKDQLVLADPYRLAGGCEAPTALPDGGWQTPFKQVPMSGFQDEAWTGIAWAPVAHVLVPRRTWVIEGVPKDRYYLYGRIELYIDTTTFQGSWNRKFSWKGELLNTLQTAGTGPNRSPDGGKSYFDSGIGGCVIAQIAENVKMDRATVSAVDPRTNPINWTGVPLEPRFFDHAILARFGK